MGLTYSEFVKKYGLQPPKSEDDLAKSYSILITLDKAKDEEKKSYLESFVNRWDFCGIKHAIRIYEKHFGRVDTTEFESLQNKNNVRKI